MRFRRRRARPPRGEYPPSFTHGWLRRTLPSASPAEARAVLRTMRARGWTEAEIAERILPFMPRPPKPAAGRGARADVGPPLPERVSTAWLDRRLPAMDREEIRLVVEELERRGWLATELAVAVLPHLLPKLAPADADAILAGLRGLGMSEEEISRLGTHANP